MIKKYIVIIIVMIITMVFLILIFNKNQKTTEYKNSNDLSSKVQPPKNKVKKHTLSKKQVMDLNDVPEIGEYEPVDESLVDDPPILSEQELLERQKINGYFIHHATEYFNKLLNDEPDDNDWASDISDEITNELLIDKKEAGFSSASLKDVRCTLSICEIVFIHDDLESVFEFNESSFYDAAWRMDAGDSFTQFPNHDSDRLETHVFITRPDDNSTFEEIKKQIKIAAI